MTSNDNEDRRRLIGTMRVGNEAAATPVYSNRPASVRGPQGLMAPTGAPAVPPSTAAAVRAGASGRPMPKDFYGTRKAGIDRLQERADAAGLAAGNTAMAPATQMSNDPYNLRGSLRNLQNRRMQQAHEVGLRTQLANALANQTQQEFAQRMAEKQFGLQEGYFGLARGNQEFGQDLAERQFGLRKGDQEFNQGLANRQFGLAERKLTSDETLRDAEIKRLARQDELKLMEIATPESVNKWRKTNDLADLVFKPKSMSPKDLNDFAMGQIKLADVLDEQAARIEEEGRRGINDSVLLERAERTRQQAEQMRMNAAAAYQQMMPGAAMPAGQQGGLQGGGQAGGVAQQPGAGGVAQRLAQRVQQYAGMDNRSLLAANERAYRQTIPALLAANLNADERADIVAVQRALNAGNAEQQAKALARLDEIAERVQSPGLLPRILQGAGQSMGALSDFYGGGALNDLSRMWNQYNAAAGPMVRRALRDFSSGYNQ